MRRKRPNYWLPTEPRANLDGLLGESLTAVFVGLRRTELTERNQFEIIGLNFQGGPLFLYIDRINTTWVARYDSLLRSLVIRNLRGCPFDGNFLGCLYEGDSYEPAYLRADTVVNLTQHFEVGGVMLTAINVHKLPDNYYTKFKHLAKARDIHSPHECAIDLVYETGSLLIGYQMDEFRRGHRFLRWDDISNDFPKDDLSLCLELQING